MDTEKLEKAPVHNLAAERSVGFINYGLQRRGAKQLACASSAQVKAKAEDLIEKCPSGSYKAFMKKVSSTGQIPAIIKEWERKQQELIEKGMQSKEIANIAVDKRRIGDLETLKKLGGPFTDERQVEDYMNDEHFTTKEKNKRLYLEVRYARDNSLSIPKTSDIFRLKKEYKNLSNETYATNLKLYLSNVTCKNTVTFDDFELALRSLNSDTA